MLPFPTREHVYMLPGQNVIRLSVNLEAMLLQAPESITSVLAGSAPSRRLNTLPQPPRHAFPTAPENAAPVL